MLNQQLLNELVTIFEEDYDIKLSSELISEFGNSLVYFYELLLKIEKSDK